MTYAPRQSARPPSRWLLCCSNQSKGGHDVQIVDWRRCHAANRVSSTDRRGHERVHGPPFSTARAARVTCWSDSALLVAAIAMALSPARTIVERFFDALPLAGGTLPRRVHAGTTYQGFSKAMLSRGSVLLIAAGEHLRARLQAVAGAFWMRRGFVVFAADGSRVDCPRTIANEVLGMTARLDTPTHPQLLVTCLWHMGLGVLWDWRIGTIFQHERGHLLDMLARLPARAMIVADAGFVGFDLLRAVHDSGRFFLIRVGSGTRLLTGLGTCRREGPDTVYFWPERRHSKPPLRLRLLTFGDVHVLTNVLDPVLLSRAAAGELYRARWGVEVNFRTLKQTLGRRKMRCAAPAQAKLELHATLLGLTLLQLMALRGMVARGVDPLGLSTAAALRTLRSWWTRTVGAPRTLLRELSECFRDPYERLGSKTAWHWPHKKNPPHIQPPVVRPASALLRRRARHFFEP